MSSSFLDTCLRLVPLDKTSPESLYQQLYDGFRESILSGRLEPGMMLPPTRALAKAFGISRSTVVMAFEHLIDEGYLEARVGSGTYVNQLLPENMLLVSPESPRNGQAIAASSELACQPSVRGLKIIEQYSQAHHFTEEPCAFRPGLPALDVFPTTLWRRLSSQAWRRVTPALLGYTDPQGYAPLREALATYLQQMRGVRCTAEQVIIVMGTQESIMLAAQVLLDPGDQVWIEDPGYTRARAILHTAGAHLVPVRVGREGLDLTYARTHAPDARMVYITPSHQYPLGVTMSLRRRLELLEWATREQSWILEDDYDSEFRYNGRPLSALQGLDTSNRVIYMGTFSKVLSPGIKLGYMVVPPQLVDAFVAARGLIDRCPPFINQDVLATFINEDHFSRHLRKMRLLYAERQEALIQAIHEELGTRLSIQHDDAGLHLIAWLPAGTDDRALSKKLLEYGIYAPPLSFFAMRSLKRTGLVLGYAAIPKEEIYRATRVMAPVIQAFLDQNPGVA